MEELAYSKKNDWVAVQNRQTMKECEMQHSYGVGMGFLTLMVVSTISARAAGKLY